MFSPLTLLKPRTVRISLVLGFFLALVALPWVLIRVPIAPGDPGAYVARSFHDPDGIGRFYQGREIAQVMGHRGARWLERPSRQWQEQPDILVQLLGLRPTDQVADIGAGTGYLSFRLASQVPQGQVWAVDIQPEMIEILESIGQEYAESLDITNIQPILGTEQDPNLPDDRIDLALMVDAYHEFAYPREIMENLKTALKPGGRVVLAEYRGEDPWLPIKRLHKMREAQVRKELEFLGFRWLKTDESLPQQHLLFFENP
ncbi:MAG: class I SAM-dependent methyltransferase [Prochlorothrix sp.]|nr:class I SAM-dependent methyltransferase [Prochlorothrix sp.]